MNFIQFLKKTLLISLLISPYSCMSQNSPFLKMKTTANNYLTKSKVDPNRHSLSFSGASNYFPLKIPNYSSSIVQQNIFQRFPFKIGQYLADALYLNYQYSLKNNFAIESGFKYMTVYSSYIVNLTSIEKNNYSVFWSSAYALYSFDLGTGYKIVVNNNLRLFDVHLGLNLNVVAHNKKGVNEFTSFSINYRDKLGSQKKMFLSQYTIIEKKAVLAYYIGLSKDIRITNNLYLTTRYHNYFGRKSTISKHTFKYQLPDFGIDNEVTAKITAKGKMYTFGLKWIF